MKPGDRIGEYLITKPISVGQSGQADVYLAHRADGTGDLVAIKTISERDQTPGATKRFEEEAQILTRLRHRNIVRLEAFDTSPPAPYIAQEFVDGRSVADLLNRGPVPLSLESVLQIASQVADALHYAHSLECFEVRETTSGGKSSRKYRGIIHRDLSTDNILVAADGGVKLIDFGIARAAGVTTLTTGTGAGKAYYMAPELEVSSEGGFAPTADVYSYGVCLYEMIMTGRPEKQRTSVLRQFQRNSSRLLSAFPEDVPTDLRTILVRCVEREPRNRPQSMQEVCEALSTILGQLTNRGHSVAAVPQGLTFSPEVVSFDRLLRLDQQGTSDATLRVSVNEDETRLFVLCDRQTKVHSFNLSGGEKRVHHVPHGERLSALAGGKGERAFGALASGNGFLLLDETGEWHCVTSPEDTGRPTSLPDSLATSGGFVFYGNYTENRVCRVSLEDGAPAGTTPAGRLGQLGPLGVGAQSVFCIDMVARALFKSDSALAAIDAAGSMHDCGWPISLAVRNDALFVVDAQRRQISLLDLTGNSLAADVVGWGRDLTISQVVVCAKASKLIAVETSLPALLFFSLKDVDCEALRLRNIARRFGIETSDFSYAAIERTVVSSIRQHDEGFARQFVNALDRAPTGGPQTAELRAAVLATIPSLVQPERRVGALRQVALRLDELGNSNRAEQLYSEYLDEVKGFDPEMRDHYGRLLESNQKWEEIKEFEGNFLSQSYFAHEPSNRTAYEGSYLRLRKAYAKLGVPIPAGFKIMPASEASRIRQLLTDGKYEEARTALAETIDNETYRQMKASDAVAMLTGYASSIKRSLRVMTLEDWQEAYRALRILVRDYSSEESFDQECVRDMEAARRQIEKLKGSVPPD